MLSVAVCVETRIYRDGLVSALKLQTGIANVSFCEDARLLPDLLSRERSDIALLDVQHGLDAASALRCAHKASSRCAIVALGAETEDAAIAALIRAGAAGYVTTGDSIEDLVRVIFAASRGELCCTPRVMRMVQLHFLQTDGVNQPLELSRMASLSRREMQVLELVSLGRSNKEIARGLCLEVSTVKNHVHSVMSKLHVRTRHEAVRAWGTT
jgi:DNA-binding NarL/FixJ family response regulator